MPLLIRRLYFKKMIIISELPLERWRCTRLFPKPKKQGLWLHRAV